MPTLRIPRPRLRNVCLCAFVTSFLVAIVVFVWAVINIAFPLRRAYYLELDYQEKLIADRSVAQPGASPSVQPLVEDVEQIFYWTHCDTEYRTYDHSLGLNFDGTAKPQQDWAFYGEAQERWIYLTGTSPDSDPQPNAYTHKWKEPDCDDPAHICDSHLDAFRRIAKRWPTSKFWGPNGVTARTQLRWIDCDISPLLCHPFWGFAGTNLLIHMKVGKNCDYTMIPTGSCSVQWRWIGLPVYHAAWTRQIRIPLDNGGSTVVPAFPSAEEQMWNVMTYPEALGSLDYRDRDSGQPGWNSMSTITPVPNDIPIMDGGPAPMVTWGGFRSGWDNPWQNEEWPYEYELKCYAERYSDIFLGWWDDAKDIVKPRNCTGVAEARRLKREEEERFWVEWKAKEDRRHKRKWDKMMDRTLARIREHAAREKGTIYDDATCSTKGVEGSDYEDTDEDETDNEDWGARNLFGVR